MTAQRCRGVVVAALLCAAAGAWAGRPTPPPACGGPRSRWCELQKARAGCIAQLDAELAAAGGEQAPATRPVARLLTERAVLLGQYLAWGAHPMLRPVSRDKDLESVRRSARRAVAIMRRLDLGRPTPDLALALTALGAVESGGSRVGADSLREALALWTVLRGGDHPEMLPALEALADRLISSSRWDELAALLERADRCQQAYPDSNPDRAAYRAWRRLRLARRNNPGVSHSALAAFAPSALPLARAIAIGRPGSHDLWIDVMMCLVVMERVDDVVAATTLFLDQCENGGVHVDLGTMQVGRWARGALERAGRPELAHLGPRLAALMRL